MITLKFLLFILCFSDEKDKVGSLNSEGLDSDSLLNVYQYE